jgi:hypothetical protein
MIGNMTAGGGSYFSPPHMVSLNSTPQAGVVGKYYGAGGTGGFLTGGGSLSGGAGNTGIVIVEY